MDGEWPNAWLEAEWQSKADEHKISDQPGQHFHLSQVENHSKFTSVRKDNRLLMNEFSKNTSSNDSYLVQQMSADISWGNVYRLYKPSITLTTKNVSFHFSCWNLWFLSPHSGIVSSPHSAPTSSPICLFFCVTKFDQRLVGCLSALESKSITLLSHSSTCWQYFQATEGQRAEGDV